MLGGKFTIYRNREEEAAEKKRKGIEAEANSRAEAARKATHLVTMVPSSLENISLSQLMEALLLWI